MTLFFCDNKSWLSPVCLVCCQYVDFREAASQQCMKTLLLFSPAMLKGPCPTVLAQLLCIQSVNLQYFMLVERALDDVVCRAAQLRSL